MGPKYIARGSLLCSAAKAPGHRRAMKVLQIHCICKQRSPFIPRECASYGIMEKQAQHPPLPSSHLHNTFTKSERVGFVRGACLCTLPALWGAITRPVPLCSVEHNSGSWGLSRSFFFLFSARVLTEAFTCGVIDALQLAINRQSLFTWAGGPLSADSTVVWGGCCLSCAQSKSRLWLLCWDSWSGCWFLSQLTLQNLLLAPFPK